MGDRGSKDKGKKKAEEGPAEPKGKRKLKKDKKNK